MKIQELFICKNIPYFLFHFMPMHPSWNVTHWAFNVRMYIEGYNTVKVAYGWMTQFNCSSLNFFLYLIVYLFFCSLCLYFYSFLSLVPLLNIYMSVLFFMHCFHPSVAVLLCGETLPCPLHSSPSPFLIFPSLFNSLQNQSISTPSSYQR